MIGAHGYFQRSLRLVIYLQSFFRRRTKSWKRHEERKEIYYLSIQIVLNDH